MPLHTAGEALAGGRWAEALEALDAAGPAADSNEGWALRAQAAYGNGQLEASLAAWEQGYTLGVKDEDPGAAAMAAAMLSMYLMMDTGMMAPVRIWMRRAQQLIVDLPDAPAQAVVAMVATYERFMSGDLAAASASGHRAVELGERLGVGPAVVIGRTAIARVHILTGDVEKGLELLDDVAAVLMTGGADPLTTGMMFCELNCAAQGLALHDRAAEWTEVMERWRHGAAFGGINGRCRVHRAEMMRLSGPCEEAEGEALGACDELRPWMRREFGWPLVELGNVRLRKGDLAGAEESFLAAHRHAWTPNPGLALLRLEQGDVEAAAVMIADAIAHPMDIPSKERPPFGDLRLAPLYEAQAQIAFAASNADTTRAAAEALRAIADRFPGRWLDAAASLAEARSALMMGRADEAIGAASGVVVAWVDIGAPFEASMARLVLAEAYTAVGNHPAARMERAAALAALTSYGAQRWVERVAGMLDAADLPVRAVATPAAATFRAEGGVRVVTFGGPTVTVRDLIGLRYIERLLADPGREFHVLELVSAERGHDGQADSGLPVLDEQARDAYRLRLAEVDDDIDDAMRMNDVGRVEKAQMDREYLIAELSHAVGLGGRLRQTGGTTERARTSAARSIRYALDQLAGHHPIAAGHLQRSIRTGTYCSYQPDPVTAVSWHTR
jgi:tetratricopeptide (TPR) repeat protein